MVSEDFTEVLGCQCLLTRHPMQCGGQRMDPVNVLFGGIVNFTSLLFDGAAVLQHAQVTLP
jgi:hypothetical protein